MSVSAPQRISSIAAGKLRSTPLRVKLLAAVLALVFAALTLISVSSTFALRTILLDRLDTDLRAVTADTARDLNKYGVIRQQPGTGKQAALRELFVKFDGGFLHYFMRFFRTAYKFKVSPRGNPYMSVLRIETYAQK